MSLTLLDSITTKLHVSQNVVWVIDGDKSPVCTELGPADFATRMAQQPYESNPPVMRLVGRAANAELIVLLYNMKLRGRIRGLQLATPLVCHTHIERQRPEAVLYHMRRFQRAPSLGGFHEVTDRDYVSYAMAAELVRTSGQMTDRVRRFLYAHPAWRLLSFIPHLNEECCARLLAKLLDPRWHVDICHPDRTAKMESFLGLNPKTQDGVTLARKGWRWHDRCQLVLNCWKDIKQSPVVLARFHAAGGARPDPEQDTMGYRPADFVWRVWGSRLVGPLVTHPNPVMADLRASQKFIQFLRLTWLSAIYAESPWEANLPMFRSQDFFRYVVEAKAYDHHILSN
jgi:hypothetical protein